jgi:hypothetical protein
MPKLDNIGARGLQASGAVALLLLAASAHSSVSAPATLYATRFEPEEGFSTTAYLAGSAGWISAGSGGNGIVTNYLPDSGQSAYLGFFAPDPGDNYLTVWRPVNYTPTFAPVVNFSVVMQVVDSSTTNSHRDNFRWEVFNAAGQSLFYVLFDNYDLSIWRGLDNGLEYDTTWSFTNVDYYQLEIAMNFASNRWDAFLGGTQIVTNEPITTTGAELTFGDADAVWLLSDTNSPGDNYMLFDDYTITVDAPPTLSPLVHPPQPAGAGLFLLRVDGQNEARYAVEASTNLLQWTALKTNVATGGYFDYLDTGAGGSQARYYRARWVP